MLDPTTDETGMLNMDVRERRGRQSTRLANFDYASAGAYFVTICSHERKLIFGSIAAGQFMPSEIGTVIATCWYSTPEHFPHVTLDAFAIMPNHVHGIVLIGQSAKSARVGVQHAGPPHDRPVVAKGSIGAIVRSFKSAVTKIANEQALIKAMAIWQSSYHDRVIRNDQELNRIRQYIEDNPSNWETDRENPNGLGSRA